MLMANTFLNFRISDEEREAIDKAAAQSGIDRSKQARALIRYALGIQEPPRTPYIPIAGSEGRSFNAPAPGARRPRRRRT
jgi:hypothetical protein